MAMILPAHVVAFSRKLCSSNLSHSILSVFESKPNRIKCVCVCLFCWSARKMPIESRSTRAHTQTQTQCGNEMKWKPTSAAERRATATARASFIQLSTVLIWLPCRCERFVLWLKCIDEECYVLSFFLYWHLKCDQWHCRRLQIQVQVVLTASTIASLHYMYSWPKRLFYLACW